MNNPSAPVMVLFPQGMYNLVLLAQEGHVLPLNIRSLFNASHRDEQDTVVEKILKRCFFFLIHQQYNHEYYLGDARLFVGLSRLVIVLRPAIGL